MYILHKCVTLFLCRLLPSTTAQINFHCILQSKLNIIHLHSQIMSQPTVKLPNSNNAEMYAVGLGTWRADEKGTAASMVRAALEAGYRHIDCASIYGNQKEIGEELAAIFKEGKIKREDVFITSKLWNSNHGHVKEALQSTLKDLQLDYLDLFLIHFPIAFEHTGVETPDTEMDFETMQVKVDTSVSLQQTWQKMEELIGDKLVKHIGVSNYGVPQIRDLLSYCKIKPAVNQIETSPYFQRLSLVKFCLANGISVTAHTPLGGGKANAESFGSTSPLDDKVLIEIGSKYNKSAAQVCLRWGLQRDTVVIPKSSKPNRIIENFSIFDFKLTEADMVKIESLNKNARSNNPVAYWGLDIYA